MRHIEYRKCRKCGKTYKWAWGGIIATPQDYSDRHMCSVCRKRDTLENIIKAIIT